MGTKQNPGRYDCHAQAAIDEPLFTLLARDPDAPATIENWADMRERREGRSDKVREARKCAEDMRQWRLNHQGAQHGDR